MANRDWYETAMNLLRLANRPGTPGEGVAAWTALTRVLNIHAGDWRVANIQADRMYVDGLWTYEGVRTAGSGANTGAGSNAHTGSGRHANPGKSRSGANYTKDVWGDYIGRGRWVDVTCQWCGQDARRYQEYAGAPYAYCSEECKTEKRRSDARDRMRARRAKR